MNFDDEARAGLLCHLVVGEPVSMGRTGDWLNTGHLVELVRVWMNANGAWCDWQDRVVIARIAADFAPDVLATFSLTSGKMLASRYADGWRLDYQQSMVCERHDRSASRLGHA
jgi:hypothetical protein